MRLSAPSLIRLGLFLLSVCGVIAAWQFDLLSYLTLENIERYRHDLGPWAPAVFSLAFVVGELLQVPSVLWIFFAGIIWPWWFALPLSLIAALVAATGAFLVARYFLGDRIAEKLPPSFQELNAKLTKQPVVAVIVLRLTTFLHPVMYWVLAASSVRLPPFLIGTLIGIIPMTLALVLLGEVFMSWWDDYSFAITGAAAAVVLIYIVLQRRKQLASVETTSLADD